MSLISGEEVPYRRSYLFCMGFERKVTSVEETNDRVRHVAFECLRTSRQKEWVVLSPCRQERSEDRISHSDRHDARSSPFVAPELPGCATNCGTFAVDEF